MLAGAALALKTRHAALEDAARQELPELALDELRKACPVVGLRHRAQEGLEVLGDDWTWSNWMYAAGKRVIQDPDQPVTFLGVSYYYRFR